MTTQLNSDSLCSSRRYAVLRSQKPLEETPISKSQIIRKSFIEEDKLKSSSSSTAQHETSMTHRLHRNDSDKVLNHSEAQNSKYNYEALVKDWETVSGNQKGADSRKEHVRRKIESLGMLLDKIPLKHNIAHSVDKVKSKTSLLSSNFAASVEAGKNIHEKYQSIQQLAKGGEITKVSRKSTKLVKRFVYYSETLEAICWRDPKSKVPKTKQMVYLTDIVGVNESMRNQGADKKKASLKIDETNFFAIETSERTYDFLAPNNEVKMLWVRAINLLVLLAKNKKREGSSGKLYENELIDENRYHSVAANFNGNISFLQKEIDDIKGLCDSNHKRLRKNFLEIAEEAINHETEEKDKLEKIVQTLDGQLKEAQENIQGLKIENLSVNKHLEASNLKGKQLLAQLKSYNDDKKCIMDFIRQFQKKLLNCVEFLSLLDFDVQEKDGEKLVSTNSISEGAFLNQDFSNLDIFMGQMQVHFDNIMFRTGQMQKRYSDLQEQLKENAQLQETTEKNRETFENQYNEIYALYNETVQEKEKLISELTSFNGQLNNNVKENIKLKKEISELEDQLNEVKSTSKAKDAELQQMIEYAKKLQNNMEYQFEELKKDSQANEIDKLTTLEDRYNIQIKRYENKILENEKVINEFSDLVQNYETQMTEYVQEIETKQNLIEDLTFSRDKLNQMIMDMEENMKKNKDLKTPTRSTSHTISQWRGTSTLESLDDPDMKENQDETNLLSTHRKISVAFDEREVQLKKNLSDMESHLLSHREEIERLQEENEQYKVKVEKVKQYEEQVKEKITHYKLKMKDIKQEGAMFKKQFKQLELYMSHWLNLIYLQNMIISVDESESLTDSLFTQDINHSILFQATKRIKQAFQGNTVHEKFIQDIILNVESSIPNISFDPKSVELAQLYSKKPQPKPLLHQIRSNDLSTTLSDRQGQALSIGYLTPFVSETGQEFAKLKGGVLRDSVENIEGRKSVNVVGSSSGLLKGGDETLNKFAAPKKFALVKKTRSQKVSQSNKENRLDFVKA